MPPFGKRPGFLVRQESPFNAGPAPDDLSAAAITPTDLFFVRNHGDVPEIDAESHRLEVDGLVENPLSFSLAELRTMARSTVAATVQCNVALGYLDGGHLDKTSAKKCDCFHGHLLALE